jgi:hypothetical protein
MLPISPLTYKVVAYQSAPDYDMDECVDWAVEMIELGYDTEHLLILAGLTKRVNFFETEKYLQTAMNELGLKLKTDDDGVISYSSFYIMQIAKGINTKENLKTLADYVVDVDYSRSAYDFYSLHWAWSDMEWNDGQQWYWPDATPDNIEVIVTDRAKQWLISNMAIYSQFIISA